MNFLDVLILIPLVWACFKGFKNGLIKEAFSLASLFLGVYLAMRLSGTVAENFSSEGAQIVAFVVIFAAVLLLGWLGSWLAEKIISKVLPGLFDHLGGIVFGAVKVMIVCSFVLNFVKTIDVKEKILTKNVTENSALYKYVEKTTAYMIPEKEEK